MEDSGVFIDFGDGDTVMIYARFATLVADEKAIKEVLHAKGASGFICCPKCVHTVDHKEALLLKKNILRVHVCKYPK